MAIAVQCVGCGKRYSVDLKFAGKRGRCKNCGATFVVPAISHSGGAGASMPDEPSLADEPTYGVSSYEPAPIKAPPLFATTMVRPPPMAQTYAPPYQSSAPSSAGAWRRPSASPSSGGQAAKAGGGAIGVLVVLRLLWIGLRIYQNSTGTPNQRSVAISQPPERSYTLPPELSPKMIPPVVSPPSDAPAIAPSAPLIVPRLPAARIYHPPAAAAGPLQPNAPVTQPPPAVATPAPERAVPPIIIPVGWTARPDAPAARPTIKPTLRFADTVKNADFLYPAQGGGVVAVGQWYGGDPQVDVWDLTTGVRMSHVRGKIDLSKPVLSPDGEFLAGVVHHLEPFNTFEYQVWSMKTGELVQTIASDTRPISDPEVIEYLPSGKLVTLTDRLQVWDVATGAVVSQSDGPLPRNSTNDIAVSPGGRLVAIMLGDAIALFDAAAGKLLGGATVPQGPGVLLPHGVGYQKMAFSPDGSQLAAFFFGSPSRLVCWSVADGSVAANFPLNAELDPMARFDKSAILSWLPDGAGWLVQGKTVVDRTTESVVFTLPDRTESGAKPYGPRFLVDNAHAIYSFRSFPDRMFGLLTVPLPVNALPKLRPGPPTLIN